MHFSGEDQCCGSEMPAEMRDEKIVAVSCQLKCGVGCRNSRRQSPLVSGNLGNVGWGATTIGSRALSYIWESGNLGTHPTDQAGWHAGQAWLTENVK